MRPAAALGCLTAALGTSAAAAALLYALLRRRGGRAAAVDPATRVSRHLQAEYGVLSELVPQPVLTEAAGFHSRLVEICRQHTASLVCMERSCMYVWSAAVCMYGAQLVTVARWVGRGAAKGDGLLLLISQGSAHFL